MGEGTRMEALQLMFRRFRSQQQKQWFKSSVPLYYRNVMSDSKYIKINGFCLLLTL